MATEDETQLWERKTVETILLESIKEQRRARRWKVFFKIIIFGYIGFFILGLYLSRTKIGISEPHTALIEVNGIISPTATASSKNINAALNKAFKDKEAKGIILSINSPGGSPVQANQVFNEVRRLENKYPHKKVYAVCNDLCASAAYYIASSADDIYADPSSMVGSIGVLMNGFGFVDTLHKVGATRRLLTAGSHKGFMDPFSPMTEEDKTYAQKLLDTVHEQFIKKVEEGRGKRLHKTPELFTGRIWTGEQAMKLGLIDKFGDTHYVARDVIKEDRLINYTQKPNPFARLAKRFSSEMVTNIIGSMKTKIEAIWQ